ncbi:MAG: diacylglycerol/lipid kinase family protein [Asticcacaulis sp.]
MADQAFNILINRKAGTVLNMGEDAIRAAIEHSGLSVAELNFCEPQEMQTTLQRMAKDDAPLLIGGGDGTIRECAHALEKAKKAFGILPFGTMNLLATDLGVTTLAQALAAYASGVREDSMDAGFVNGEIFLCCASIGTMPQASVFREANRHGNDLLLLPRMFMFVLNNLDKNKRQRVALAVDGKVIRYHAAAVVVSANRFADTKLTESNFKRATLTGGELAAYAAETQTRTSNLRLLARMIIGHWLRDPAVSEVTGKAMKLWTRRRRELVSIDGEVCKLPTPLDFTLKPRAIRLLVPDAEAAK